MRRRSLSSNWLKTVIVHREPAAAWIPPGHFHCDHRESIIANHPKLWASELNTPQCISTSTSFQNIPPQRPQHTARFPSFHVYSPLSTVRGTRYGIKYWALYRPWYLKTNNAPPTDIFVFVQPLRCAKNNVVSLSRENGLEVRGLSVYSCDPR